jgi:hypothetical protein
MAQTNPVNVLDSRLLIVSETAFGTTPTPADVAAYAARALEFTAASLGPIEQGEVRDKKDRSLGRGMRSGFVEGRKQPGPVSVELSIKSRASATTALRELALYRAAGLKATTTSAVALTTPANPVEDGDFASCSMEMIAGTGAATTKAETVRGCVIKSLKWDGGDQELKLTATGASNGNHVTRGALESITVIIGATTLSHTAEESYRLQPGYYLCESEVILVGAVTAGSTSTGITRAQLGTSAAAHTTKPLYPYLPAGISFTGAPIAEPISSVIVDGVTLRALSFSVELTTGMDHLPGETGSAYVQGVKTVRYDVKATAKLVLKVDDVALLGKATARKSVAVSFSQGTAGGGRVTFSMPTCELEAISVPDSPTDIAIIDLNMRVRDNVGNDALSITFD